MNKKVALVTGGSRGIGRAISLRLAADGFHIIVNYRSRTEDANQTLELIEENGGSAELLKLDITDSAAVMSTIQPIVDKTEINVLVFSAGIHSDSLLIFMEQEQWDSVLATNLSSFYHVAKPIVRQMLLNRDGRIIVISSTSGESGMQGQTNYAAAKAGIIGAVKSLALECAKRGVLVNAITPGFITTEMTDAVNTKEIARRVPLQRFGKPEEVAGVASFLASMDSSYITGQVIRVNGGVYM